MTAILMVTAYWLIAGLCSDHLCEDYADRNGVEYDRGTQLACYIAGPIVVPIAFAWAILRRLIKI